MNNDKCIIILFFLVLLFLGLSNCNYSMEPNETKVEYGTTETDSKNDKLQEKKSTTQTWKWKKK